MRKQYKRREAPNLPLAKINLSDHELKIRKDNELLVRKAERLMSEPSGICKYIKKR